MNDQLREDIKTALNECGRWDNPDIMTEMTNAILPIIARAEEKARAGQREAERAKALVDAVEWARSCSGEAADAAADYIEEMADSETKKKKMAEAHRKAVSTPDPFVVSARRSFPYHNGGLRP